MRALLLALSGSLVLTAQSSRTTVTASNSHLSLQAIVEPEVVAPGAELTIAITVTPARRMHVYAPGSEYRGITVTLEPQPGVKARRMAYPPSESYYFEPLDERVPVYTKPFMLKQVVAVRAPALKGKDKLTLAGRVEYQACDDRVCYKPDAIPFTFELRVKR